MLLTIEKLIYGGDGLAHLPADESGRGKAAFIPFVLAGEQVDATIAEQKPSFVRATADAIAQKSPHRIEPGCVYFASCGGCHYQHTSYEHQLEIKKDILRETLRRTAKLELQQDIEVHPSPPWNYRNRSRLQVRHTPEFITGYFKLASHEVLRVEQCPISSPLINRAIASLWQIGRAGNVPRAVREVEFFANADDTQLLVEVTCSSDTHRAELRAWVEDLQAGMPQAAGVSVFRDRNASQRKNRDEEQKSLVSVGDPYLIYKTLAGQYRVSAGSFFQANRHLADELIKIVTDGESGKHALDLYAGVGFFSTALARDFHHVVSVEASQTSFADLSYNRSSNGEVIQATTEQYLARSEDARRIGKGEVLPHISYKPDLAVVDPPRGGLGERVARGLATLGAPRVTYVSCDPATLARDLVIVLGAGYRVERVHLIDMFPQTYHIESVVQLAK